ncbi:MAG: toll/interleukin-1 receptor domain-containing protein [Verrucomicrobia bacterium]|nr:toll/interleukin-1 receptor domain-containing protein [Verrucomicrobiota bacterium]MBV8278753.1 toll/interleukin-1 receptor domain-containing protein [Verrucomicrobiota bacterium]
MVADALRIWLEQVIQGCNPWMSNQDIDAGQRWATELFAQLDNHTVGIICVTKDNQGEPWLNFEAGALAKQLKGDKPGEARVCPLLIEMNPNDVTGPLKHLQMMPLDEGGMFKVLQMVNKYAIPEKPLREDLLKQVFDVWWPLLRGELIKMKVSEQPEKSGREEKGMLEEMLGILRSIDRALSRELDAAGTASAARAAARTLQKLKDAEKRSLSHHHDLRVREIREAVRAEVSAAKDNLILEAVKYEPKIRELLLPAPPEFANGGLTLQFSEADKEKFALLKGPPFRDVLCMSAKKLPAMWPIILKCEDEEFYVCS